MKSSDRLTKNNNLLDVKIKNYGECGYCLDPDNRLTLNVPWHIWAQWTYISREMGEKEWGAVFWVKDDAITSFKIPKQEVSFVECEFKEELGGNGLVHSHHDMGAFHSLQDDHHARNLYDYSIVLSNGKGYEATKRIKLACGGFGYAKVELQLIDCPEMDLSKITVKKELSQNIPERHFPFQYEMELNREFADLPCNTCVSHNCGECEFAQVLDNPCDYCEIFECETCRFIAGSRFQEGGVLL